MTLDLGVVHTLEERLGELNHPRQLFELDSEEGAASPLLVRAAQGQTQQELLEAARRGLEFDAISRDQFVFAGDWRPDARLWLRWLQKSFFQMPPDTFIEKKDVGRFHRHRLYSSLIVAFIEGRMRIFQLPETHAESGERVPYLPEYPEGHLQYFKERKIRGREYDPLTPQILNNPLFLEWVIANIDRLPDSVRIPFLEGKAVLEQKIQWFSVRIPPGAREGLVAPDGKPLKDFREWEKFAHLWESLAETPFHFDGEHLVRPTCFGASNNFNGATATSVNLETGAVSSNSINQTGLTYALLERLHASDPVRTAHSVTAMTRKDGFPLDELAFRNAGINNTVVHPAENFHDWLYQKHGVLPARTFVAVA